MTKEEALHWLDTIPTIGEQVDALEMAIKALEQEPTTKNDLGVDCISRADALDCVNWGYSFSDIYKKINELPSVTPQEPKIKVLDRDEATRKLGTVDVYKASAWITLLKDLEYLGMKICEVKQGYLDEEVYTEKCRNTHEMAIKALEQEPIFDKIRAEIKAMSGDLETIADVLAILDKYKAETENP